MCHFCRSHKGRGQVKSWSVCLWEACEFTIKCSASFPCNPSDIIPLHPNRPPLVWICAHPPQARPGSKMWRKYEDHMRHMWKWCDLTLSHEFHMYVAWFSYYFHISWLMLFHMCLYFLKIIESWLVHTSCLVKGYGPAIVVHWQAKGSAMAGCSHGAWLFLLFFHPQ